MSKVTDTKEKKIITKKKDGTVDSELAITPQDTKPKFVDKAKSFIKKHKEALVVGVAGSAIGAYAVYKLSKKSDETVEEPEDYIYEPEVKDDTTEKAE